jgi:hypothetical protein
MSNIPWEITINMVMDTESSAALREIMANTEPASSLKAKIQDMIIDAIDRCQTKHAMTSRGAGETLHLTHHPEEQEQRQKVKINDPTAPTYFAMIDKFIFEFEYVVGMSPDGTDHMLYRLANDNDESWQEWKNSEALPEEVSEHFFGPIIKYKNITCPNCKGTGGGQYNDCPTCGGNGVV